MRQKLSFHVRPCCDSTAYVHLLLQLQVITVLLSPPVVSGSDDGVISFHSTYPRANNRCGTSY